LSDKVLAVLGLGSNRGDSRALLGMAIRDLSEILDDVHLSSMYRTAPQDYAEQDDFLNLACSGLYDGSARDLLGAIHRIEANHGRDRESEISKGPRTLDIDILLFGDAVMRESDLVIPHERMRQRQFALVPLLELLPDSADPETGESYRLINRSLGDQGVIKAGTLNGN
jgi:2-amino-4-hydroxy-6-hydroxymethyldihydropteridine diphosphokinase